MLADKPPIREYEQQLDAFLRGRFVVTFDLPVDVRLFPECVVGGVRQAEKFKELQNTLLKWSCSLENASDAIDFKWHGPKGRAQARALALRAVWKHLAGWATKLDKQDGIKAASPKRPRQTPKSTVIQNAGTTQSGPVPAAQPPSIAASESVAAPAVPDSLSPALNTSSPIPRTRFHLGAFWHCAIVAPFFVAIFKMPVYTVAGAALMGTFLTPLAERCSIKP